MAKITPIQFQILSFFFNEEGGRKSFENYGHIVTLALQAKETAAVSEHAIRVQRSSTLAVVRRLEKAKLLVHRDGAVRVTKRGVEAYCEASEAEHNKRKIIAGANKP